MTNPIKNMSDDEIVEMLIATSQFLGVDVVEFWHNAIWLKLNDEIMWNTDEDTDDLLDSDGNTYSTEYVHSVNEYGKYIIVKHRNNGHDCVDIFLKDKEVHDD